MLDLILLSFFHISTARVRAKEFSVCSFCLSFTSFKKLYESKFHPPKCLTSIIMELLQIKSCLFSKTCLLQLIHYRSDEPIGTARERPQGACWMPVLTGRILRPATGQPQTAASHPPEQLQSACSPGLCQTTERSPPKSTHLSEGLATCCGPRLLYPLC